MVQLYTSPDLTGTGNRQIAAVRKSLPSSHPADLVDPSP
ncbi:hypothetical protein Pint_08593 [Pistacia integerrima]|uniref:Uncharacterized protein n=1 Tax=Pistacia integerrima TaxID=434235 RepID=A0ACC0XWT9_9ROSI|nr:hypothetical protein Pint_08593 [Pistacia integerrima]